MLLPRLLVALTAFISLTDALSFKGRVEANETLSIQAFASLTNVEGEQKVPIVADKSFEFHGLTEGDHVLRLWDMKYSFLTYAIRLSETAPPSIHVYQLGSPTFIPSNTPSLPEPFVAPASGEKHYEEVPGSFDPIKMIRQNPVYLMMIVGALLGLVMPAVLKYMDPEVMKEVEQSQADLHAKVASFGQIDIAESLSKRLASTNSGSSTPARASPSPAHTPTKGGGGGGGGKNKKKKN